MNLRKLELEDQGWFPVLVKEGMTDYLRFLFKTFDLYHPVVPLLHKALKHCNEENVVDLCSGSGGAIETIMKALQTGYNRNVCFNLTDIFPRISTWQYLSNKTGGAISFFPYPVDATNVPSQLKGFRTIFSGIHHFDPDGVRAIIRNSVDTDQGIGIFDGGDKNLWMMVLVFIFHLAAILLLTPFIKPFRWWRLVLTYPLPLIPLGVIWDGLVSVANLYKPRQLLRLAKDTDRNFHWRAGYKKNRFGLKIAYLIGVPDRL